MRVLVGLATLMLNGFVRASVPVLSRRVCYHNSLFQRPGTHKFVRFASRRHRKQNSNSDDNSDSDSDESDDEVYDQDENDPYYEEDVAFSPQFRQLTTHVKALRYDKVLRAGLNLTRATVEDAFFASRLRLNGQVLLKKATVVDEGDKLDLVLSEEFTRTKAFLIARPPLALSALVLLSCLFGLIGLDLRIHLYELKDPDVEKHWNNLLLELSKLEFCFTNSSGSKTMSDVFPKALSSDDDVNGDVISQSVEQHVLMHPTPSLKPGVVYRLTAQMYGRHIAIKGPLALQQFNVSFELHTGKFNVEKMNRETKTIRLKSCVTFTASKQILPRTTLRGACHNLPLFQWSRSPTEVGHLEWAKRSTVFTMNRCAGRVRLHTDFHISSDLLPRLHEHDISVISFRLRVITAILIGLLLLLLGFGIRQTNSSLNVQGSQITNFQPTEPLINQVK